MIEWKQMTMQEAENKMEVLREIFDVVRLLKGSDLQAAGMESKLAGREILASVMLSGIKIKDVRIAFPLKHWRKRNRHPKLNFLILICIRYLQGIWRLTVSLM